VRTENHSRQSPLPRGHGGEQGGGHRAGAGARKKTMGRGDNTGNSEQAGDRGSGGTRRKRTMRGDDTGGEMRGEEI
jgi:hypothetical protein